MIRQSLFRTPRTLLIGALVIACSEGGTTPPPTVVVDRIEMSTTAVTVSLGTTHKLGAQAVDASGDVVAGISLTWSSADETIATVSGQGTVTAVLPGTTEISASGAGKTGKTTVTVPTAAIRSVTLEPAVGFFEVGTPFTMTAEVRDELDQRIDVPLTWRSVNPAVATVSSTGVVTPLTIGQVQITASAGTKVGTADITVIPIAVANVIVSPHAKPLFSGETTTLSARVEGSLGQTIADRPVTWQSRNFVVASVSQTGVVTALSPGEAWVVGTSEGIADSAKITVTQPPAEGYELEVSNFLLLPVLVAVNGGGVMVVQPGDTVKILRPVEATVRVAWSLITPTEAGFPIGETVTDVFPETTGPNGAKRHFDVRSTLTDGRRIFTPSLKNVTGATVHVGFTRIEGAPACNCPLPGDELEHQDFGYWFLPADQTMRLYRRGDGAHAGPFVSVPVPAVDVNLNTGKWSYTVVTGP